MRKALIITGGVFVGFIVVLLIWKYTADARYFNDYDPNLAYNATVQDVSEVNDTDTFFGITRERHFQRIKFSFQTRPGEMVPALLTLPTKFEGKLPVIVFLHGIGQSKEFLDDICTPFNQAGFAMACFDQSMQGERKVDKNWLKQAVAFRQRPWKTINDARRFIGYLQTLPDIDPERIYLIGASYGAITGCSVVAFDKRIRAADLVVGGGNIPVLLDAPLIKNAVPGLVHAIGKRIVSFIMRPADPVRYASQTSPTPLLFQNGSEDTLVTPDAGKELFEAAGDPKEIRWYPCDHPGLNKSQGRIILQILDEGLQWLVEQDKPFRKNAAELQPAA